MQPADDRAPNDVRVRSAAAATAALAVVTVVAVVAAGRWWWLVAAAVTGRVVWVAAVTEPWLRYSGRTLRSGDPTFELVGAVAGHMGLRRPPAVTVTGTAKHGVVFAVSLLWPGRTVSAVGWFVDRVPQRLQAGIFAHECAHLAARHSARRLAAVAAAAAVPAAGTAWIVQQVSWEQLTTLQVNLAAVAFGAAVTVGAHLAVTWVVAWQSRQFEREADLRAAAAGFAAPLADALAQMDAHAQHSLSKLLAGPWRTHPPTAERVTALRAYVPRAPRGHATA